MKQILAIAFGILMLGSDASEAEYMGDEESEAILANGTIINKIVLNDFDDDIIEARYHVAFADRIYRCAVIFSDSRVGVMCYNSD